MNEHRKISLELYHSQILGNFFSIRGCYLLQYERSMAVMLLVPNLYTYLLSSFLSIPVTFFSLFLLF